MKRKIYRVISKIALAIIIASLAVMPPRLNAGFSASAGAPNRPSEAPSSLQGDDAIRNLKERGLYDSLREAVAIAGFKTDDPPFILRDKLIADDGMANDSIGRSVAIYRDTALVGAPSDDIGANTDQGSAYVFVRGDGTSWSLRQKLTASDGAAYDQFGSSVAIYLDFAIVGAPNDDVGAKFDQGSAYVFERGGGSWTPQTKLTASDGAAGDKFGYSVAIDTSAYTDTLVVGAPYDDNSSNTNQGSAYVFERGGNSWVEKPKLIASDGAAGDYFGLSVAIDKYTNTVAVGAPYYDTDFNPQQGSVFIFARSGGSWIERQLLTAGDGANGDNFGASVAISLLPGINQLAVMVAAPNDDMRAISNLGSAYIFSADIVGNF